MHPFTNKIPPKVVCFDYFPNGMPIFVVILEALNPQMDAALLTEVGCLILVGCVAAGA